MEPANRAAKEPAAVAPSPENGVITRLDYIPPRNAANEEARLKLLRALNILDTGREDRFSSITTLMCTMFQVPIAAVSLVEEDK